MEEKLKEEAKALIDSGKYEEAKYRKIPSRFPG